MLDLDPAFRPVRRRDGCLPLEDLGLIGDGATVALVGLDGSIPWLCVPLFDAEPLFCGLLDQAGGGQFSVVPEDLIEARHAYQSDTAVLVTDLRTATGTARITDALAVRSGADLTDDAPMHAFDAEGLLAGTAEAWRRWMTNFSYAGPEEPLVRRSAITMKLCDHSQAPGARRQHVRPGPPGHVPLQGADRRGQQRRLRGARQARGVYRQRHL
jgi:GH15 family glucan-1,4-alpha-glucosidase